MIQIAAELDRLRDAGLYRRRRLLAGPQAVRPRIDGREMLAFCSNDYLGLAAHPAVIEALREGAVRDGVGSGASHLITGHHEAHEALEATLAAFMGRERALLFSTGYMANLGVIQALCGRGDQILADRLNHASLLDGARLSQARLRRYPHADIDRLQGMLGNGHRQADGCGEDSGGGGNDCSGGDRSSNGLSVDKSSQSTHAGQSRVSADHKQRCLILTDGVFSMDGDLAPIPALASVASNNDALLMVDDAHGIGVLGAQGRGSLEHVGLEGPEAQAAVPILVGTLGKAIGTFGAFVAGSAELIELLIQRARSYIYTTALPPALATATLKALQIAQQEPERREHLQHLISRFRAGAETLGLNLADSPTPIQPLIAGDVDTALRWSQFLEDNGILVTAIRPPTVPQGSARLRITLSAAHQETDVDRLLETLARLPEHLPAWQRP
ncbi:8-amino-7-oxononanoate synthase [Lamprobacter modestohalophilus]|uniref:aminotransferase class I/II-fold pyridoxal phosphate-dependent enzyme n=1 Tax=Lamprobacter modestohalophilus TaxID=1064514 RepID=UPI002ADEAB7A|nr:8-amino-7-oxononanoate synthase [Lamprobacter modestohalophilus]MEA1051793.1 8-amino-7-oxononanoate synthase [Lamprobacter modestohalophilus]